MRTVSCVALVFASLLHCSTAVAGPWAIVAAEPPPSIEPAPTSSIFTIDLGTAPPTVYGPFLEGSLGTVGVGAFDVVVLPNRKRALVSTFGDRMIHKINLSDPTNPRLVSSLDITFFAEDIALSPDGRTALVADGGYSPLLAFVDVPSMTLRNVFQLPEIILPDPDPPVARSAQGVAVAPDGMVFMPDYYGSYIHYGKINPAGTELERVRGVYLCTVVAADGSCEGDLLRPVNVSVSPDGDTVLAAIVDPPGIAVLKYNSLTGRLRLGKPGFLPFVHPYGGFQSIAFGPDRIAYAISSFWDITLDPPEPDFNRLSVFKIVDPGVAKVKYAGIASSLSVGTSQLFGVDVLAVLPDGKKALVSNMTLIDATDALTLVNLETFRGTAISLDLTPDDGELGHIPAGVAIMDRD